MKIIVTALCSILITINVHADKKWIPIETTKTTQKTKENIKLDVNLSKIQPINKLMRNVIAIKQLIDSSKNQKSNISNNKNWYVLDNMEGK